MNALFPHVFPVACLFLGIGLAGLGVLLVQLLREVKS